jgi:hypothetical protein
MKPDERITLQDITDWMLRSPDQDPAAVRRIKADIKQPDSLVREYLNWEAGKAPGTTPRLVEEHMRQPGLRESWEKVFRELSAENDRFLADLVRKPTGKPRTR